MDAFRKKIADLEIELANAEKEAENARVAIEGYVKDAKEFNFYPYDLPQMEERHAEKREAIKIARAKIWAAYSEEANK
jgi:predicted  nucleic acid-binding Zn-ribbon protein